MSQVSSQIHDAAPISIPFVKFSHNTSPLGCRNFIWNHIGQRDDLRLVIQNNRVIDEQGNYATRIMLRITAGMDTLEAQDLGELVKFAREHNHSSGAEHPVQVVVRSPFMAMKYPKSINSVRRIQLKFRIETDFSRAVNILTDLGFPITESGTSSTSITRPSISPAQLPFSSASSLPSNHNPTDLQHTARNQSPTSNYKNPVRPASTNSEPPTHISALSFGTTSFNRPASASTISMSAPVPSSSSTLKPFIPYYHTTEQLPAPYRAQFQGPEDPPNPILSDTHAVPALANAISLSQHQIQQQELSNHIQAQDSVLGTSRFFIHPSSANLNSSPPGTDRHSEIISRPADFLYCKEPQTNPDDGCDDELPPRRELPFPKLRESGRYSSAPDLTHLPKPTPEPVPSAPQKNATKPANKSNSTPTPKPAKKRVAQRKPAVKKPPEVKPSSESHTETGSITQSGLTSGADAREDEPSPLAAKSNAARPASTSGLQTKVTAAKKRSAPARPAANPKKPKMVDQSTQTQTLSGRNHTSAQVLSLSNGNSPPVEEPSVPPPQGYVDLINAFITTRQSAPAPKELWERPRYADADEEQRQLILNDFICENLENPEFLQLCADTEKAWRRIGLGM